MLTLTLAALRGEAVSSTGIALTKIMRDGSDAP